MTWMTESRQVRLDIALNLTEYVPGPGKVWTGFCKEDVVLSPKFQLYAVMLPVEIEDVLAKLYCRLQALVVLGVNESTGLARRFSVCVKLGPGHPGMSTVVQV